MMASKVEYLSLSSFPLNETSNIAARLIRQSLAFLVSKSIKFSSRGSLLKSRHLCATDQKASRKSPKLSLLPRPALVFVTPNGFCSNLHKALQLTEESLKGETSLVQIRDLRATEEELVSVTETLLSAGIPQNKLSINGLHPNKVRLLSPSLGIHIREKDILRLLNEAQRIMDVGAVVSCSVHCVGSAAHAMSGDVPPSYIQVGTMYPTQSHPDKVPEGVSLLRRVRKALGPSQMLIGIGGINEKNIAEVVENGADGVAVISSISGSRNPRGAASQLMKICQSAYDKNFR